MNFFNEKPKRRLLFLFSYLFLSLCFLLDFRLESLRFIIFIIMLFLAYISAVKCGLIEDKNTNNISNLNYDILSVVSLLMLFIKLVRFFNDY